MQRARYPAFQKSEVCTLPSDAPWNRRVRGGGTRASTGSSWASRPPHQEPTPGHWLKLWLPPSRNSGGGRPVRLQPLLPSGEWTNTRKMSISSPASNTLPVCAALALRSPLGDSSVCARGTAAIPGHQCTLAVGILQGTQLHTQNLAPWDLLSTRASCAMQGFRATTVRPRGHRAPAHTPGGGGAQVRAPRGAPTWGAAGSGASASHAPSRGRDGPSRPAWPARAPIPPSAAAAPCLAPVPAPAPAAAAPVPARAPARAVCSPALGLSPFPC